MSSIGGEGRLEPDRQLAEHVALARELEALLPTLELVAVRLIDAFAAGRRLYTFGNGGSAADAQHLAAELIGRYQRDRRPLPAVALTVDPSVVTCIANDYAYEEIVARQVAALAGPGDVVLGFTTSGRSPNIVRGLEAGRAVGATTVLFAGGDGEPAVDHADIVLLVPSGTTARIQEMHLVLLHLLSEAADAWAAEAPAGIPAAPEGSTDAIR
jgi:D-sedoheptulose 7-phosphate isomerase